MKASTKQANLLLDTDGIPRFTLEGDEPPVLMFFAGTGFLNRSTGHKS